MTEDPYQTFSSGNDPYLSSAAGTLAELLRVLKDSDEPDGYFPREAQADERPRQRSSSPLVEISESTSRAVPPPPPPPPESPQPPPRASRPPSAMRQRKSSRPPSATVTLPPGALNRNPSAASSRVPSVSPDARPISATLQLYSSSRPSSAVARPHSKTRPSSALHSRPSTAYPSRPLSAAQPTSTSRPLTASSIGYRADEFMRERLAASGTQCFVDLLDRLEGLNTSNWPSREEAYAIRAEIQSMTGELQNFVSIVSAQGNGLTSTCNWTHSIQEDNAVEQTLKPRDLEDCNFTHMQERQTSLIAKELQLETRAKELDLKASTIQNSWQELESRRAEFKREVAEERARSQLLKQSMASQDHQSLW
eukprot:TRINITY_DN2530_c0_g5_i1.p1 TRINITY_DN2530_c0_g5~~TRINITY_DN2530_c0_g5_i1.p1  ORF type:complete len:366 (-),score=45.49 TRINITY_DN2530_c0_g5_i1:125-1222(-)